MPKSRTVTKKSRPSRADALAAKAMAGADAIEREARAAAYEVMTAAAVLSKGAAPADAGTVAYAVPGAALLQQAARMAQEAAPQAVRVLVEIAANQEGNPRERIEASKFLIGLAKEAVKEEEAKASLADQGRADPATLRRIIAEGQRRLAALDADDATPPH